MKLVLFDIDGTILSSGGAGRRAVQAALREVFGASGPEEHEFSGKTDPQIVRELMEHAGVADSHVDDRLDHVLGRYVELLHTELAQVDDTRKVFPGIHALLEALEARDDVMLGLLTGNVREGAVAKLTSAGIDSTRFVVGAYGSDHAARQELPAIALTRAIALIGSDIPGRDVVVIGDTPADMSCGRGIGARAIGVATGSYSEEALAACNAAAVFPDFSDTEAVMAAIMETS